jgi:hypothetical protein
MYNSPHNLKLLKNTHNYRVFMWIFAISIVQKMCVQDFGSQSVPHMFVNHVLTICMVHNWTYHYLQFSLAINEKRLINTRITDALLMWIFAFNMWYQMCVLQYASRSVAHMFGKLGLTQMSSHNWPNYYLWCNVQFTTQVGIIQKILIRTECSCEYLQSAVYKRCAFKTTGPNQYHTCSAIMFWPYVWFTTEHIITCYFHWQSTRSVWRTQQLQMHCSCEYLLSTCNIRCAVYNMYPDQ